jgi:hypothetical protein
MKRILVLLMLISASANAQVVAAAGRDFIVAHDGRVERFDAAGRRLWSAEGPELPSTIAVGSDRALVLDAFHNETRVYELGSGRAERLTAGETPVDARFVGNDPFILDRDSARLQRAGGASIDVAPDPAFLRASNERLYVYSRLDGIVQEIDPVAFRVTRTLTIGSFASAFEIDGRTGYLLFPRDAKLRTFDLATFRRGSDIAAGAVPVGLAIASRANALSASRLVIADPSAKRVSIVEGSQSVAAAIARGFIRGLLGLGLFRPSGSQFPTGVDRVATRGSITVAYDSTTQTLYRMNGAKSALIARDIAPGAFAVGDGAIAVWQGRLRLIR